jgi:hypothetical protein
MKNKLSLPLALVALSFALSVCNPTPTLYGAGAISMNGDVHGTSAAATNVALNGQSVPTASGTLTNLQHAAGGALSWQGVPRGYFGDGNDSVATFDGSATPSGTTLDSSTHYTLTRDVYYSSGSVAATVTVQTNGWRFFCNATFTITSGAFLDNGGFAGAAGSGSGVAAGGAAGIANSIGGTSQQGVGGAAAVGANAIAATGLGGAGGAGGTGGGVGGSVTQSSTGFRLGQVPEAITTLLPSAAPPFTANITLRPAQGGGGGGGGINTGNNGGGGGGGGGVVMAAIWDLEGGGTIRSRGGNGGNASVSGSPGGGGGGGVVIVVTNSLSAFTGAGGTFVVTGGAAGTGGAGGASAGGNGQTFLIGG